MKAIAAGIGVGVATAIVGMFLVGYASAVAIPKEMITFFSGWTMYLWETLVVQLFSYGISILLFIFVVVKVLHLKPWSVAVTAFVSCEVFLIAVSWPEFFIYIPHIVIVALCAALAAASARQSKHV